MSDEKWERPLYPSGFPMPTTDLAIVANDPMSAVIEAVQYRRAGISVHTELQGKKKSQLKRAARWSEFVIDLDAEVAE